MNDKWLILTLVMIFTTYVIGTFTFNEDLWLFVQLTIITTIIIIASLTINLILYHKNKSTKFTLSYIFLGVGLINYAVAEIIWLYLDAIGLPGYPSEADYFYFINFIFASLFCIKIVWTKRCFIPGWIIALGILAGSACFGSYILLSLDSTDLPLFLRGTIMMVSSSILFGSAVMAGTYIYKSKDLKNIWVIIGVSLGLNCIADIFYYVEENTGHYEYFDWTTLVWYGSLLMLFYALYTHRYLYTKL